MGYISPQLDDLILLTTHVWRSILFGYAFPTDWPLTEPTLAISPIQITNFSTLDSGEGETAHIKTILRLSKEERLQRIKKDIIPNLPTIIAANPAIGLSFMNGLVGESSEVIQHLVDCGVFRAMGTHYDPTKPELQKFVSEIKHKSLSIGGEHLSIHFSEPPSPTHSQLTNCEPTTTTSSSPQQIKQDPKQTQIQIMGLIINQP